MNESGALHRRPYRTPRRVTTTAFAETVVRLALDRRLPRTKGPI